METIQVIRGMRDILPEQARWFKRMERQLVEVLESFGYGEIRTPMLEPTELFSRSIGEETDIVEKEMYTFQDRDGSWLTLRPEGTASVVRSYIENSLHMKEPLSRLYYLGPMFRHERPQKGRYRQFSQVGVELFGAAGPAADVEMIDVMVACMAGIGLAETRLELNSLGCPVCRPAYRNDLVDFLRANESELCEDCRRRLRTNPLRILDCKNEQCIRVAEKAPHMLDALCDECADHFAEVRKGIAALHIDHNVNHRMVRGLDYYTRTTFELLAEGLGAQNAVAAGGRYDDLVEALGGLSTPAVGFAAGLDRILLKLMEATEAPREPAGVFMVTRGQDGWLAGLEVMRRLRADGIVTSCDVRRGSMKAQMKRADKAGARFVLLIGEEEIEKGVVTVKDMAAEQDSAEKQFTLATGEVSREIAARLKDNGEKEVSR